MITWGINAQNHDASIAVVENDKILFAAHSERYSGKKFDADLNQAIVDDAMQYGVPDIIAWSEKPFLKKTRQWYSGEETTIPPKKYLEQFFDKVPPIKYFRHHKCHAAGSYLTSEHDHAAIVVIDAIGEWDTVTIWEGKGNNITLKKRLKYPHSLGLLYGAFTQRVGMTPNRDEYILMGMSAYGRPIHADQIRAQLLEDDELLKLKENVHLGIDNYLPNARHEDLAASIQSLTEDIIVDIMNLAKKIVKSDNLVYSGGVALNCVANAKLFDIFENIWIMPNPSDAGNSLGAAALVSGRLDWKTPYLGTDIKATPDINGIVADLKKGKVVGLAFGRAEYGPRALGNRSLLVDPRGDSTQDEINKIKRRESFRPFAPIIMEEHLEEYFDIPVKTTPYMQFIGVCKEPEKYPAICHKDNTSRIQTINEKQNPIMYNILKDFYEVTGCPMLLNTSLNIKNEPLVNDKADAERFEKRYGVKVY